LSLIHEPCPVAHDQLVTALEGAATAQAPRCSFQRRQPQPRGGTPMPKRTRSEPKELRFTEPPLRGFLIHLSIFIVVICGLAALNLARNPAHLWFLWVLLAWGIALAIHDLVLLVKTRPKRGNSSSAKQASGISEPTPPTLPKHHRTRT